MSRRLSGLEFLLHAPFCSLFDRLAGGEFFYTPRAGICLIVCRVWNLLLTPSPGICLVVRRVESLYYMPRAGICLVHKRLGRFS